MAAGGNSSPAGSQKGWSLAGIETIQLALFLVLLAFFFALVAGAEFDDKRRGDVVSSVRDAFPASFAADKASIVGRDNAAGPTQQRLNALYQQLSELFPSARASATQGKNAFLLDLPAEAVFLPSGALRTARLAQAGQIIAEAKLSGIAIGLAFPGDADLAPIGGAAQALAGAGVPASRLSVARDPSLSGRVNFRIAGDTAPGETNIGSP